MTTCRRCQTPVLTGFRYCPACGPEIRRQGRRDHLRRKYLLKPLFEAQNIPFQGWRSLRYLYRQLGLPMPQLRKFARIPAPPNTAPEPIRRRLPRKATFDHPAVCANPACEAEFIPRRRDQIYCTTGRWNCQQQAYQIRRSVKALVAQGRDPDDALRIVLYRRHVGPGWFQIAP